MRYLAQLAAIGAIGIAATMLSLVNPAASAGPALEARKSNVAGVQVVVTPRAFDPAKSTLDFDVVLDTHTKPLNDDLVRVSELIADGRTIAPSAWQGDPPGGHHRKGVLQFPRPEAAPSRIEIRMTGIGGAGPRTFKWE